MNIELKTEKSIAVAHKLQKYKGPCGRLHGHTLRIEVFIKHNNPPGDLKMLTDFRKIKEIIEELDHRNLNDFLDYPSMEQLSMYLLTKVKNLAKHFTRIRVKVWESRNSYVMAEEKSTLSGFEED